MSIHTTNLPRVVASVACTGLVIASAGFGAVYAHQVGIEHGKLLAGLTVLFAVALELVKPLAISEALRALGSWRTWLRAVALSILGLVAVAYSLTAELSLTALSRGDLTAKREHGSEAHSRARTELASLKPSRSVGELEPLVAGAPTVCRVEVTGNGGRTTVCTKSPALLAELGRAKRREALEHTLGASQAIASADPGASALKTYLAAVGLPIDTGTLGEWLVLVPVLALELGSALAVVLCGSMAGSRREPPAFELIPPQSLTYRDHVARSILNHLQAHGGTLSGSERTMAKMVGTSKPTLRRTILALADQGTIKALPGKTGTQLQLLSP